MNDFKTLTQKFNKGDKVKYLGHPAFITSSQDIYGKTFYSLSYDKGFGKTKVRMILSSSGEITKLD